MRAALLALVGAERLAALRTLLSASAREQLGALATFGVSPFPNAWAVAASPLPAEVARRALSELRDFFLVTDERAAPGEHTHDALRVHAHVHALALEITSPEALRGDTRRVVRHLVPEARGVVGLGLTAAVRWFVAHGGTIDRVLDHLTADAQAAPPLEHLSHPTALPATSAL